MENNKLFNLFHNINESELNILTRKFTLKAFQALFPYIIKCKQLNIFISDNLLFINKNVNREKRNYMIDYNQINMLNVDAELKLKNDLMNKYYAIQFGKMINEKIFIKSSKNDNSQIHFSFSLIDKPEKIYLNNTDEISAASLGIVKSNDKFRFTTSKEVDDYNDFITLIFITFLIRILKNIKVIKHRMLQNEKIQLFIKVYMIFKQLQFME